MLLELNIRDIALIERLTLPFQSGLNVLTGETGAGKSIVVDAMNLALGGRADRSLIRTGADKAFAQAVFDVRGDARVLAYLEENGMSAEDGCVSVSRELGGRNLCRVSGEVATLSQLRQLTGMLVELHGQHEHQALLASAKHMGYLDHFGGAEQEKAIARARDKYRSWSAAARSLEALKARLAERARLADALAFQISEIDAVKPKPGEDERLEKKFTIMQNAEKISSGVRRAYSLVYEGTSRSPSAQEALQRAGAAMEALSGYDERFAKLAARLSDAYYAAQDIGYELQALNEEMEFDPGALDKAGERLNLLERLTRKYGPTIEDVIAFRQRAEGELKELEEGDSRAAELEKSAKALRAELADACAELTERRKELAGRFSKGLLRELAELGMGKARFDVRFASSSPSERGADEAEFMISLNPGEPLKSLSTTASGGELSRVMLAIKAVMAETDQIGTMIFDEVDTGVSGAAARVVGEKLSRIGARRQVIAVSHLPQIAALADAHFAVEKSVESGRTATRVTELDEAGRVRELSRLVGGGESGDAHARSMLASARETKDVYKNEG